MKSARNLSMNTKHIKRTAAHTLPHALPRDKAAEAHVRWHTKDAPEIQTKSSECIAIPINNSYCCYFCRKRYRKPGEFRTGPSTGD